jgi:DNA-binding Lrp family transcriptional regulator
MAKNSAIQIKEDEKKIINELEKNANNSINEIANKCKFSRQKVWRIIKNLEKNNTIWGYTTVIDEEKQDMKKYFVLIKRTNLPVTDKMVNKVISRDLINKSKELDVKIISSTLTNGAFDYIICYNAPDIKIAKRFVENLNKIFEGMISEIHLVEQLFSVQKCGIQNPNVEKIKEFFNTI